MLVEMFHMMVMKLIYDRKMTSKEWSDFDLTPRAKKMIDQREKQVNRYHVNGADEGLFCVTSVLSIENRWTVDVNARTCDCCVWDLTGLLCVHAVAVLLPSRPSWTMFSSPYYHASTYKKAYAGKIVPLPEQILWDQPAFEVGPPGRHRLPGRPKGVRRLESDEIRRASKRQRICGRCKLPSDHNARGCQGGPIGGNTKKRRDPRPPREPKSPRPRRVTNTVYNRPKVSRGPRRRKAAMGTSGESPGC
ncbi:uncharacterized protein M6B38_220680 [Iris pallida]|uniref:SWIM-type domain-containing protein n=1 Tax=Iris pallida TaxID=29817 RepID=A0AAX6DYS6_IRIPA|nr:uncharacterized protein M6B38_220680 [Iris pallida]